MSKPKTKYHRWMSHEITFIKNNYPHMRTSYISDFLQIPEQLIRVRAGHLGIRKQKEAFKEAISNTKMQKQNAMFSDIEQKIISSILNPENNNQTIIFSRENINKITTELEKLINHINVVFDIQVVRK